MGEIIFIEKEETSSKVSDLVIIGKITITNQQQVPAAVCRLAGQHLPGPQPPLLRRHLDVSLRIFIGGFSWIGALDATIVRAVGWRS